MEFLSDKQIAEHFVERNTIRPGESPVDLEARVEAWLARVNLGHRRASPIAIQAAIQAAKLAPEPPPAPVATAEQAAT